MVDLDSDPTKLIDIVEIGKQLLITRGSLTTFSIANDVAKYFAIIPAMFARLREPECSTGSTSWTCRRRAPRSCPRSSSTRSSSCLIPLALRGVKFVPIGAAQLLRRNLLIYGVGGMIAPVHRHQAHRPDRHGAGGEVMRRQLLPAILMMVVFTLLLGHRVPARGHRHRRSSRSRTRRTARIVEGNGRVVGSSLHRPDLHRKDGNPLHGTSSPRGRRRAGGAPIRTSTEAVLRPDDSSQRLEPRPDEPGLPDRGR